MIAEIVFLLIGVVLGGAVGYLISRVFIHKKEDRSALREELIELDKTKSITEDRLVKSEENLQLQKVAIEQEREKVETLKENLGKHEALNKNLEEKLELQKEELNAIQKKFTLEFENIANKLLKQNTVEFAETNQKRLDQILKPFKDKIVDFEKKVSDAYDKESKDRNLLKGEIRQLVDLNRKISEEANNLTKALKGDNKKQGNWGEIVLERVLERSGLTKGQEYLTQSNVQSDEGQRIQPDVIIYLPEDKHVIVDSKVTLVDYERYVNAGSELEKAGAMKSHLNAIRTHVKGLSEKSYQEAKGLNTPDFVLMFIPIESCFSDALREDHELFNFAWEKKIVIVSPTTLLATLQTIASIWKQERQTRNALEIAKQSGALYDKFVGFLVDMEKIEKGIGNAHGAYNEAMNKLKFGSGNLIRRVEKIKKLGARTNKDIPQKLMEDPPALSSEIDAEKKDEQEITTGKGKG